jgi:O-antigen/teichoic acid export membrane protein
MYYFVTGYLFYESRTGLLSMVTVSVACVQTLLSFWLAAKLGGEGVAIATFISAALYFFATWLAAQRAHPMPWFSALRPRG